MTPDLSVKKDSAKQNPNLDYSNSVSSFRGRVYNARPMTTSEKQELNENLKDYVEISKKLQSNQLQLKEMEEKLIEKKKYLATQEELLNQVDRDLKINTIIDILTKIVLKNQLDTYISLLKDKLQNANIDIQTSNLIINEEGIKEVILPVAKKLSLNEIDLTPFKDKIMGKALEIFLMDVPNTQIKKIAISAIKLKYLTAEEKKLFVSLKSQGIALIAKT